jgi:hypothetical protein
MTKNPHAVALGRKGGLSRSDAKIRAAKENGKLGGAPKKMRDHSEDCSYLQGSETCDCGAVDEYLSKSSDHLSQGRT